MRACICWWEQYAMWMDTWWMLLRPFLWSTCLVYTPAIAGDSNMYSDFVIYRCYSCNFSGRFGVDIVICLHTLVCEPGLKLIPVACFKPCLLKLLAAKSNSYCSTACYQSKWHSWCKPHFFIIMTPGEVIDYIWHIWFGNETWDGCLFCSS